MTTKKLTAIFLSVIGAVLIIGVPIMNGVITTQNLNGKITGFFIGYMGAGDIYMSKSEQECVLKTYRKYMTNEMIKEHVEEGYGLPRILGEKKAEKLGDELANCLLKK